ncbi:hypothetical protein [Pacificibacter marinus]|uniref:hypothetical protein n=1 Tax=Pacificibacter marinus TaxID=658057 RepID=UPI001C07D984|nr:hypothetical protein [Pacificibacter marinus]MBU2867744.1 hypothetical protein [Pacificibacter marinus]
MKQVPKETTDDALIREFLEKGGSISKGKTKPMPNELRISNNAWNTKLTKEEKASMAAPTGPVPKIPKK